MSNSNCKSINLIYIIYCNKCLYYYIGQTNNFRNRFNAHKRNILLSIFDENSLNDGFELYKHFSSPNHSLKDNLNFYILEGGFLSNLLCLAFLLFSNIALRSNIDTCAENADLAYRVFVFSIVFPALELYA